jgi:pimeloyl-ACP methyl ester carboxylesterase
MQSSPSLEAAGVAPLPSHDTVTDRPGYVVAGAGAPVVMLHASLGSKSQWTALAERLSSRYRVIAIDLHGYGDNALPAVGTSFTLEHEVRLVAQRLDRLVEPHVRVHMIGHSYGGLVALRCAQSWRGRVESLALFEPVVFNALEADDATLADVLRVAERVARLVATGRRRDAAEVFIDFWSGAGSYRALSLPVQVGIARRVDKVPLDFRAACGWPRGASELRGIATPALLMSGNRSPAVVRRIHDVLVRMLPNRSVASFDGGHMAPITDAHRVNPWIEAFVDLVSERAAVYPAAIAAAATAAASRPGTAP